MPDQRVVIVYIEGGLASNVEHPPDVDVHIIDLDTEGAEEEGLCDCEMAERPHFHTEYPGDPVPEKPAHNYLADAAPALLAALATLVMAHDEQPPMLTEGEWAAARVAIAKATGAQEETP